MWVPSGPTSPPPAWVQESTLPRRFTEEASTLSGSKGHVSELDGMLAEYYAVRGWQDGVVPEDKLRALQVP